MTAAISDQPNPPTYGEFTGLTSVTTYILKIRNANGCVTPPYTITTL